MSMIFLTPRQIGEFNKLVERGASSICINEHPDPRDGEPSEFIIIVNFDGKAFVSDKFDSITDCLDDLKDCFGGKLNRREADSNAWFDYQEAI